MDAKDLFTRQYRLTDPKLLEELCAVAEVHTVPRGTVFLRAGQIQTHVYLLLRGVARGYFWIWTALIIPTVSVSGAGRQPCRPARLMSHRRKT